MKPESRHALMELISYGVEELSNEDAAQLLSRIHECPECTGQWVLFEKTYTVLSQSGETEISVERSQKMWLACVEHAKHKAPALTESEVLPGSSHSDSSLREGDRRRSTYPQSTSGWLGALKNAFSPRLSYSLAAAATLVLAASLFFSPRPSGETSVAALPALPQAATAISFQTPPHATTGMLDYHSTMAFEPFSDHVAPTLVSFTATQP
ncbi:MAG TPA: hypothetical protein VGB45_13770 [Abditibacterium sp.]